MSGEATDSRGGSAASTPRAAAAAADTSSASATAADATAAMDAATADASAMSLDSTTAAPDASSESEDCSIIDGIEVRSRLCEPGRLPHQEMETFHLDEATIQTSCKGSGWTNCDARTFEVRVGPSYVSGQKTPSAASLYDVFAVDGFYTPLKINAFHKYTSIKKHAHKHTLSLPKELDPDGKYSQRLQKLLPPVIMINFMIPYYEPEMGSTRSNGEGYAILLYAKMSDSLKEKLSDWARDYYIPWVKSTSSASSSAESGAAAEESKVSESDDVLPEPRECPDWRKLTPAVRLLSNFIRAQPGTPMRQRFKCIARAMNLGYSGLSFLVRQMIHTYNAKPFLARTSSTFYDESPELFAVDIDVHLFGYPARKGLSHFRDIVENVIYDIAFVIEGCLDDELPECILLCARIARLGKDKAARFPLPFMEHAYRDEPEALRNMKASPTAAAAAAASSSAAASAASPSGSDAASPKSASASRLWGFLG